MKTDLTFLKPLVANILQDEHRKWSIQGFGFLRTYFGPAETPKRYRLNLWDHRFTVPNVSTIHDHPWDFTSVVVAGEFANQRYRMARFAEKGMCVAPSHAFTTIKTGEGGGIEKSEFKDCALRPLIPESYLPGDTYSQRADEIHQTLFADGTVTLNERIGDTERARVFWPYGTDWVDAIPRPATGPEVADAVLQSLRKWF
jgi:hypothetical protein